MPRRRIAMIFDNTLRPETTGTYCVRAMRKLADVEFFTPDQIERIPRTGFDLYLCIDDGLRYRLPTDLRPCAWWVIDTHMDLEWAIEHGQEFDWLFAAQRDGSRQLQTAGLPATWLPLACDPEIHRPWHIENRWDICFVGRVAPGPREELLQRIASQFPRTFIGQCYFDEYAKTCSASMIGFNRSIKNDVNMRVFETLGCGSLLVTNDLSDNGQAELFDTDRHLVTYRDADELFDKLRFYLGSPVLRERISQAGHTEAFEKHTYDQRMRRLLTTVEKDLNRTSVSVSESRPKEAVPEALKWIDSVDFVIKTFLRPVALQRLIVSIRKYYPTARVTVADDGNLRSCRDSASSVCCSIIDATPDLRLLELPFASGVAPGRNSLVKESSRPFLLFLDDDFEFTEVTNIKRMWDRLIADPEVGVVAGACIDVIHGQRHFRNSGGVLNLYGDVLEIETQKWRHQSEGLREYVPQFMLIRREVFQDVRWEGGVGGEHYDFCLQLMRSRWKVVHDLSVVVDHHPLSEALPGYADYRFDCASAQQWLLRKWGLQQITQDGSVIVKREDDSTPDGSSLPTTGRPQKETTYFEFARPEVAALIPTTAHRVLDIGCGAGRLGQLLKQRQTAVVTGLELNPQAAKVARQRLDDVHEQNVEDATVEFPVRSFDCIICADVLEHLREPGEVLKKIHRWLTPDGCFAISLPNARHHSVVTGLLEGNWTYESAGLLDNDHVRFFTRREIEKLLFRHGFAITSLISKPGSGHSDWVASGRPGTVRTGSLQIDGLKPEDAEEFYTYQYLVVARPVHLGADHPTSRARFETALHSLRERFPWPMCKPVIDIPQEHLGWCGEAAREVLEQELRKPTKLVIELGTWMGMSTRLIADYAPTAQVIAIDHWQGSPEHRLRAEWADLLPNLYEMFQALTWDFRDRVTPLRMTTLEGLQAVADAGLEPDLIYIDAEHSYEAVTAELDLCHHLFPQARLIGDDYDCPGVNRAVNEFATRHGLKIESIGVDWHSWRLAPFAHVLPSNADFGLTSIIIVTFNELGYTKECIESIRLRTDEPYELIFVDNGSTDGTLEYLTSIADAQIIRNRDNRGFPAAVNQGLKLARGEQVLLLNNDTVVSTGWLHKLLTALQSDPKIGLVGPCSNNVSGSQMIAVTYTEMTSMDGFAWNWGKLHAGRREETDRLIGFCLVIKKALLERIGGLDEQFGIGCFEDDDICLRALRAGWKAVIARDAFVHHYGSRTFAGSGVDFTALMRENRQKFSDKWEKSHQDSDNRLPQQSFVMKEAPGGGLLLSSKNSRLSLCMIVRNNETTIRPCLESIRPWVDEMIVVDTGSTDSTPQICEELGAKLYHWPWRDDFSAARNQSLDHASGEWIFWMDSDDTISEDCGRKLRDLADGEHSPDVLGYVIQVHCPGPESDGPSDVTAVDHVKLIRNRPDLRFEHRIHEQILPAIRRAGGNVAFTELFVVHSGSDHSAEGRVRKLERDFKLLHLDLEERPDHPFVLFNLGMTHADAHQHVEAVQWLTRCLEVSQPVESHVRKTYALLISSLMQLSDFQHAAIACERGRSLFPDDKELLFRQAMLCHELGKLDEAVTLYREVLTPGTERHFASIDLGLAGYKARHNLALVYEGQGRYDLAAIEWRAIVDEQPEYVPSQIGLAECLLRCDEQGEATAWIEKLRRNPKTANHGLRLEARRIEAQEGVAAAVHELECALRVCGDDDGLLRELSRLHHTSDNYPAALETLERLTSLDPNDASAWHNRGVILGLMGRENDAKMAFDRAETIRRSRPSPM